ncbi:MAG TPA: hypothetical protein HA232_02705, partial [Methanocellales archaeon]|nr:hypothetical protein [Methanocellales archaeon]
SRGGEKTCNTAKASIKTRGDLMRVRVDARWRQRRIKGMTHKTHDI